MRLYTHTHTHTHTSSFIRRKKGKIWNNDHSGIYQGTKPSVSNECATAGITLVALVVTIVVLLILAGTTISYVMGDNSVFKKASDAKIQTELGKIEERANLIYIDKLMQNVPESLNNKPTMQEIVDQLRTEEYKIEQVAVGGDAITGISLSRESMTLGFGNSNTIKVTLLNEDNGGAYTYYALVDGKYYQMHYNNGNITIDRTPSEIQDTGEKPTLSITNSDETVATATLDNSTNIINATANNTSKAGTTTITVTYGNYTKTCNVTVRDIPITTALEMNSVRARIAAGYTRWLGAMTTPTDALQEFEWSSSDESIATVDEKGVVTAKKTGKATIKAKTIDGSNKEGTCEVTVVENAPDVATLTDFQTANTVAKDVNGNLITVPGDFKVLTDLGTKVTEGIVIQDRDGNEFVWVPVDSVSTGTSKMADDIRLGRYDDFTTKNTSGNYVPKQDADNCSQDILIGNDPKYRESLGLTGAKDLASFINNTKENGGYYFARYEASRGVDNKVESQFDKTVLSGITMAEASSYASAMYRSDFVESDLLNSYSWDTAIVFIQKYSGDSNYANKPRTSVSYQPTGKSGDEVCNIHDMMMNFSEWSTENSTYATGGNVLPCTYRGVYYAQNYETTSFRGYDATSCNYSWLSFRTVCYLKLHAI